MIESINFFFELNGTYDLIVGGILSHPLDSEKFFASAPYLQDDMTWCVERSQNLVGKNIFFNVTSTETYIFGGVLFIFSILGVNFLPTFGKKPPDLIHTAILAVQTLIAFPSPHNPKKASIRLFFAIFLIPPFWLNQIYSAYFFTYISRVIYNKQINTFDEVATNNFRLAGDGSVLDYLNIVNKVRIYLFF